MRIPPSPPNWIESLRSGGEKVFARLGEADTIDFVRRCNDGYVHWNKLRYYQRLPEGFDAQTGWAAIAMSRLQQYQSLPLRFNGAHLVYWNPPQHLAWLHKIDQLGGGMLGSQSLEGVSSGDSEQYLFNSLMEEAIASSQLEGAVTTRPVAKKMLREGRKPRTKAERMIFNNYRAILRIRDCLHKELSPELLLELHSVITEGTLETESLEGHFRTAEEHVVVEDSSTHDVLHNPPDAVTLDERIKEICTFANERSKPFVHPVTKAIILHFAPGYVHPFSDGNGRTARAVFYWFMLKHKYWLFEYLPISRLFLSAPAKYARAYLYTETDRGDTTYFIHYNLKVVVQAIKDLHLYLADQQRQIAEAAKLLRDSPHLNHRQQSLIYHALKHSDFTYTVQQYRNTYKVSYATARADLISLADAGYLEMTWQKTKMVFYPHGELLLQLKKKRALFAKSLKAPKVPEQLAVTRLPALKTGTFCSGPYFSLTQNRQPRFHYARKDTFLLATLVGASTGNFPLPAGKREGKNQAT